MPPKRDWRIRLDDIIQAIEKISRYTAGLNRDSFAKDEKTLDAVIRNLEVLGEASARIPVEIQRRQTEVPWEDMRGMRNVLIHEYFGADVDIVWQTVKDELPRLLELLQQLKKKS